MVKNWKSATIWGIILWLMIFAEVSIMMFAPFLQGREVLQDIVHLIIVPFLVIFCSYMHLKTLKGLKTPRDGLLTGLFFLAVGTILDLAITIPLFVKSFTFYLQWSLWLGFAEGLLFSTLTGYVLGRLKH